jgi:chaperonin GroEL
VINEELGDDMDLITVDCLGKADKAVTNDKNTVITTLDIGVNLEERIENVKKAIKKEKRPFIKGKIQDRLAMLSGKVGVVCVGADSKVELKEKLDRVEDAIYATKAALKEGIVPGGGIALLNAAQNVVYNVDNKAERILLNAIKAPYYTILDNAGIIKPVEPTDGVGVDVKDGTESDMIQAGIIDPVLVTKSALKNAVSVVTTIISADCVISNMRGDESNK